MQNEIHDQLSNEYFDWMYQLVCGDKHYNKVSYKKLLMFLHTVSFIVVDPMDDNRRIDGIDFRYRFGNDNGYSREYIERYLDTRDCSVLEMMMALSFRGEEQIMDDFDYGNRTGQWFWSMINSLGLGHMDDYNFDRDYCECIINNFLHRNYMPNGKGGLFTIERPADDLRNVQIWYQFMWYLNEIIDDQGGNA